MTFIVRVQVDDGGRLHGVIERASTGVKWPFPDAPAISRIIDDMVRAEKGTQDLVPDRRKL